MEVYHRFTDPTTCFCSVYCNFTSPSAKNLVISKGCLLQIFDIIEVEVQDDEQGLDNSPLEGEIIDTGESFIEDGMIMIKQRQLKLSLLVEYRLNGDIISITKFRSNENENVDYLIISTKFAKLTIAKWDDFSHSISTVSLHYYEPALESLSVVKPSQCEAIHRTDPTGTCTSFQMNELFTFLPFCKDLLDEEEDDFLRDEEEVPANTDSTTNTTKDSKRKQLYNQSFILNASSLNADLKNILDFQFLYSYRDPTISILYAPESLTWSGYLPKLKDNMKCLVLSLDTENQKTTKIMELDDLPYDLDYIYPLPPPINGFLLIGSNEILHVNPLGSVKGIATNIFYKETATLVLKDQSDLGLKLENCKVECVGNEQILIITELGELCILNFDKIGSGLSIGSIQKVEPTNYTGIVANSPLQITNIEGINSCFICCQGGDSLLLNWNPKNVTKAHELAKVLTNDKSRNEKRDEDEDSWLYNDEEEDNKEKNGIKKETTSYTRLLDCKFEIVDRLLNCGPLIDFTIGKISKEKKFYGLQNPNLDEDAIVGASGINENSALTVFNPTIKPIVRATLKFSNVDKIWTLEDINGQSQYLITTDFKNYKTQVFQIDNNYKAFFAPDLNNRLFTVQFGVLSSKLENNIVQVTPYKVMLFDFKFMQISSLDYETEINSSTIFDKYVIVIMKNGEIDILEFLEEINTLEKLDLPALLNYQIFTNGWISSSSVLNHVADSNIGMKRANNGDFVEVEEDTTVFSTFWLITADNRLLVFKKNHKEKVFEFKDIHVFPELMQLNKMDPNYEADVDPIIKQAMFTKLGDKYTTKDYLIVLTFGGEVLIFEAFFDPVAGAHKFLKINDMCQFPIIGAPDNSYAHATKIERSLIKVDNLQGYSAVLITGASSYVILKDHSSSPKLFQFTTKSTLYFANYNHSVKCSNGLISIDDKKACRICQLDLKFDYSNRIPIIKVKLGDETITKVSYHQRSHTYIVTTLKELPFVATDEEGEPLQGVKPDNPLKATNYKGSVHMVSPVNWSIIDTIELEDGEVVNSIKIMDLKISESQNHKNMVIVGTAQYKVEDMSTKGSWKIYEVIDVVPELDKPEAKNRLKLVTSEESKGPVLSISNVSGRFAIVQGQRLLVRTLKSDNNVAPVAFTDTKVYSKEVKSFENLLVIADSYQSVSLHGFDASPYRLLTLGKDEQNVNITACDFVVHDSNLFILIADEDSILHLLQYDPYDPESLKGSKLLRRSVFRSNGYTTHMTCVARARSIFSMVGTLPVDNERDLGYEVIGSNIDGSLYKVIPVNEYQYRQLYSIQNYLNDKEVHYLGLNPKLNSIGGLNNLMTSIKRPFIELNLLKRFVNLNEDRKTTVLAKLGKHSYLDIYRDLISLQ